MRQQQIRRSAARRSGPGAADVALTGVERRCTAAATLAIVAAVLAGIDAVLPAA
ncbi:MAG: hypothetical protein ABI807_09760 [Sporichthyaceae bacterium]